MGLENYVGAVAKTITGIYTITNLIQGDLIGAGITGTCFASVCAADIYCKSKTEAKFKARLSELESKLER